jgi:hypothetical protein
MFSFRKKADAQPDKTKEDQVKAQIEDQGNNDSVSDTQLESLRQQLSKSNATAEAERQRADRAERGQKEVTGRLSNEVVNRINAEEVAVLNAITAGKEKLSKYKAEFVTAQENGKFAEAADLQEKIAEETFNVKSWEGQKRQIDTYKETQKRAQTNAATKVAPNADDQENAELDKTFGNYPTVKKWAKENGYLKNPRLRARADAAHYEAVEDKGLTFGSKEYLDYIDGYVNPKKDTTTDDDSGNDSVKTVTQQQKKTASALPPSRGNNMGTGNNNNAGKTIKLTPAQAEAAEFSYPDLSPAEAQKRYAENAQRAINEGRISSTFLQQGGNA